jgi:hypothetical protein
VRAALVLAQAPDPGVVRQTTDDVLSQADYAVTGGPSLLERALGVVLEQLGRLLLLADGDGGTGSVVAALALAGAVVALSIALIVFLRRFRRSGTADPVVTGPVGRAPVDWADEAARHEQAGDHRQALRCRYRETVARLAGAGLIDEVPGRTTGEYAAEVAAAVPAAAAPFTALTTTFEEVWYGRGTVDAADLSTVRDQQATVASAAGLRRRDAVGSAASGTGTGASSGEGA